MRFENVEFTYPGQDSPIVADINLILEPGKIIALVGENGSGKTTLAKLLLGLYTPTKGTIYYDNISNKNLIKDSIYQKMSAIFQDYGKYELSIRENLAFGNLDAINDDIRLIDALMHSGAHEIVEDFSLETVIGRSFEEREKFPAVSGKK
ncbi:putative ABC transporter ATP-binding protein [compost metagenome]